MAFKFSRGASKLDHSNLDGQNVKSKSVGDNNNANHYKTGSYPAWLKDGPALRKAYYGSLGQVQLQPALDGDKLSKGLDKLVISKRQEFSWDKFTDSSRVQQLLSTSRLPNTSLAAIWACCNKTRPGVLTNREVCLALGLIAIFQRVENLQLEEDPFKLLRLEKGPPVPKLYNSACDTQKENISSSCSMPEDLLIDISANSAPNTPLKHSKNSFKQASHDIFNATSDLVCLIDLDNEKLNANFGGLTSVWMRLMLSMQALFKRSFDILNVENSRESALEALTSSKGSHFCKGLSLCYPIAHNIKFKIDELREAQSRSEQKNLLSDNYLSQISNIMVSINEYWAVLINLFHGSGQSDFIELIMDGLIKASSDTIPDKTFSELIEEASLENKSDKCAICLTEFYLINMGDALERSARLSKEDMDSLYDTKLITNDDIYYYHPKCANFWLNNVADSNGKLPFQKRETEDDAILRPIK